MVFAMRVDNFMPVGEFKRDMDRGIREIRNSERMEGVDRIWLPGEMAFCRVQEHQKKGIPIAPAVVQDLRKLAAELSLTDRLDWKERCSKHRNSPGHVSREGEK